MITTLRFSADFFMFALIVASWPAFKMTHSRRAHAIILSILFVTLGLVASCGAAPQKSGVNYDRYYSYTV